MDDENDIVDRLLRVKSPQLKYLLHETAEEIRRLREENRQLRERSTEAVVAWINETIKRAGEAHILKKAKDGV
jgi:regulator of replication initiation timing